MRCPSAATFLLFLTIVSLALPHGSSVYADERVDLMKEYFDLVVSGNYESATHLWTESAQERSSRFGIEYAEIPVKLDCVSPIIQNLAVMRDYLYVPVKETTMLPSGDFTTIRYSQLVDGELVEHTYWAWYDSTYYWLTYPQDYYARGWPVETSRYLRIHAHPSVRGYLNAAVLREADAFIERTARSLGLGDDELRMLAERKIEYFYVDSDETIQAITGRLTKGTYDLASDDILSAFFPHHHELTHLLVNIRLRRLPLYTQPILQEGLAVHYGGRWGKSPEALTDLGVFLIREKLVELDSIMTFDGFRTNAAADIAYPVAGLFASFVLERLGTDDYLKLYLKQSGNFEAVRSMSAGEVKDALTEALGEATWSDVVDRFDGYMDRISTEAAYFLPGRITDGREIVRGDGFAIYDNDRWLGFELGAGGGAAPSGSVLFGEDPGLQSGKSLLFEEHYRGAENPGGHRFGIRADQNEAGLYDYASNHLVAKYIRGLMPSDEYLDEEGNTICVKVRKELVGPNMPTQKNVKWLPL